MASAAAPNAHAVATVAAASAPSERAPENFDDISPSARAAGCLLRATRYLGLFYALSAFVFLPMLAWHFWPFVASSGIYMGAAFGVYCGLWLVLDLSRLFGMLYPEGVEVYGRYFQCGFGAQAIDGGGLICLQAGMLGGMLVDFKVERSFLLLLSLLVALNIVTSIWLVACMRLRVIAATRKVTIKINPPILYSKIFKGNAQQCDTCVICLSTFANEDEVIQLSCRHTFHPNCIQKWLEKSGRCPFRCHAGGPKQAEDEAADEAHVEIAIEVEQSDTVVDSDEVQSVSDFTVFNSEVAAELGARAASQEAKVADLGEEVETWLV